MRITSPKEAHITKRATNLTIAPVLLEEARALNINLSATFEASLHDAVRKQKAAKWLEENREALQGYNAWIETNGLPLEKYRQFWWRGSACVTTGTDPASLFAPWHGHNAQERARGRSAPSDSIWWKFENRVPS